ncbi:cupin domain-containing protein [Cupriavidus sp. D384]|uniref:cupin domain-containing protein n=1 Tax=Cupriavidus sp. D384 TaxID=1538095 RepID=UPI000832D203|nr:cupin domain-containing protein [Cupriavidus sp. D384]
MPDSPQVLDQASRFGSIRTPPGQQCPISPSSVHSGTPMMRYQEHSCTVDGAAWTMVWDCTRSTFDWYYEFDEVVIILEGSVRVTDCHGNTHTLNVGDAGYFPCGTTWLWEVDNYVRKVAFCHNTIPRGLRLPVRITRRLAREVQVRARKLPPLGRQLASWLQRVARIGRTTASVMLFGMPL